jgi:hypothetical protein
MGFDVTDKKNIVYLYRMLEDEILKTRQYIHFHEDNLDTYSLELYNQLFLSASIFERCAINIIGKKSKMDSWKKHQTIISCHNKEVTIVDMNFTFKPLSQFGETEILNRKLPWWDSYNGVKHSLTNLQNASLRNVLFASASAGILVEKSCLNVPGGADTSKLFRGILIPTFYE